MKRYFIANWKLYLSVAKSEQLARQLVRFVATNKLSRDVEIVIAPSMLALGPVLAILKKSRSKIKVAAQDVGIADEGAYTGEVSAQELKKMGVQYVIVGHSERRQYFGEEGGVLAKKNACARAAGLGVIYCVGETKDERNAARAQEVVKNQLREAKGEYALIAYEPRWAIGTGLAIEPSEAEQMHTYIDREQRDIPICYGGSVSEKNIGAFLTLNHTSGVLVGSASTTYKSCVEMIVRMSKFSGV